MSHMPGPPPRYFSLPEEFLLLSHLQSGKVHDIDQTSVGCAAAELGELALRRKLLVRARKFEKFGFEIFRHQGHIQLLDTEPTGLVWADRLLAELDPSVSGPAPVSVYRWLRKRRRAALPLHRQTLTERGALRRRPGALLRRERHYPDPVARNALVSDVRSAYAGNPLDEHLLFLCDLVEGADLGGDLGVTLRWRQRMDRARGIGAVESVPEDLRDTSTVLGFMVPSRRGKGGPGPGG
ncbi:hypothetical protein CRI70_19720 [Streptomyces sp. Ru87]|uniref:GPP34 family phosphoprotein n=2 Tax=Streptomyces TaxID=1883 RepID=A0ABQ7FL57_9ACTN|nr:GPP34 family phosphoprotein [Streptomyces lycii]PGH49045.1 hypothetical protein CRI70_19720 [Streptomyces sp. Ru87]